MPSPIAHAAMGCFVQRFFRRDRPSPIRLLRMPARWAWPLAAVGLSFLPDLDAGVGILRGDLEQFHNHFTHSALFGLLAAALAAPLLRAVMKTSLQTGFSLAFTCYAAHLAMDLLTHGRGLMILWPFTTRRFIAPVTPFVGVPWSSPLWSPLYRWMLLNESAFVLALFATRHLVNRIRRRRCGRTDANAPQPDAPRSPLEG